MGCGASTGGAAWGLQNANKPIVKQRELKSLNIDINALATKHQLGKVVRAFAAAGENRQGTKLNPTGLAKAFGCQGVDYLIMQLFTHLDLDGNGWIDLREFLLGMAAIAEGGINMPVFTYRLMDKDPQGHVTIDTLRTYFHSVSEGQVENDDVAQRGQDQILRELDDKRRSFGLDQILMDKVEFQEVVHKHPRAFFSAQTVWDRIGVYARPAVLVVEELRFKGNTAFRDTPSTNWTLRKSFARLRNSSRNSLKRVPGDVMDRLRQLSSSSLTKGKERVAEGRQRLRQASKNRLRQVSQSRLIRGLRRGGGDQSDSARNECIDVNVSSPGNHGARGRGVKYAVGAEAYEEDEWGVGGGRDRDQYSRLDSNKGVTGSYRSIPVGAPEELPPLGGSRNGKARAGSREREGGSAGGGKGPSLRSMLYLDHSDSGDGGASEDEPDADHHHLPALSAGRSSNETMRPHMSTGSVGGVGSPNDSTGSGRNSRSNEGVGSPYSRSGSAGGGGGGGGGRRSDEGLERNPRRPQDSAGPSEGHRDRRRHSAAAAPRSPDRRRPGPAPGGSVKGGRFERASSSIERDSAASPDDRGPIASGGSGKGGRFERASTSSGGAARGGPGRSERRRSRASESPHRASDIRISRFERSSSWEVERDGGDDDVSPPPMGRRHSAAGAEPGGSVSGARRGPYERTGSIPRGGSAGVRSPDRRLARARTTQDRAPPSSGVDTFRTPLRMRGHHVELAAADGEAGGGARRGKAGAGGRNGFRSGADAVMKQGTVLRYMSSDAEMGRRYVAAPVGATGARPRGGSNERLERL